MKSLSKYLAACAVLAFSFSTAIVQAQDAPPPPPDAGGPPTDQGSGDDQGASFQQFYDQLGSQGNWVQTDDYGYVFQPNVQDPNWAPYSDGHWVYTDQGWLWVSDEPWGWATYHYGRWANIDGTGWVWIPGYQWAPAWVSWRYGGGYCGWAPLPPETFIGAEFGGDGGWATFHFGGDVDVSFGIGAGCYNFVPVGYLGERNYRGHYLDRSRNYTVINNTTNITNININKTVINNYGGAGTNFRGVAVGGPPINEVNAHARTHVPTVRLAEANQPGRSTLNGNTLSVYAPRVNAASIHQARPTRVAQTIAHPTFNRGESITQPMQVTSSIRGRQASAEAIQSAQAAALHTPARAKIATPKTVARTQFTQPLTSLQPVATRQERAAANQATLDSHAQANQAALDNRAAANKALLDSHAEANKATLDNRAQANKTLLDNHAEANKAALDNRAEANKALLDSHAEANKAALDNQAEAEKQARDQAAQERAAHLQQVQSEHKQALDDTAVRNEHASSVQQTHTAVPPQHIAPAATHVAPAATHVAPAAHGPAGDKKDGNGPGR